MDKQTADPTGFSLIFPGMLKLAIGMGLEFPSIQRVHIDAILHLWKEELERFVSGNTFACQLLL
jgi:ent-kaurene synthase